MRSRGLGVFFLFLLLLTNAKAGGTQGNIIGTVADATKAVIVRAAVTLENRDTGLTRSSNTNELGDFSFQIVPPGVYRLRVVMPSFRDAVIENIKLDLDEIKRVNVTLEIAGVEAQADVVEAEPALQTDTSSLGQVIDRARVSALPLNERSFLNFTLLVPGAQMPSDGSQNSDVGAGGAISVNGAREQSNNFLLDGIDNNEQVVNQFTMLPSVDAIEEFKVQSSNSSAEFGRSGGAQINVLLKSGTNDWHGSMFEFLRNRKLDARNFFDDPQTAKPRYDRNQFGGTIGGPLRKNKAFIFASYEGLRLREAVTRRATVPSRIERQSVLSAIPPAARNAAGVAILNLYPFANVGPDLNTSNLFVASPVLGNNADQIVLKADLNIGSNGSISGHYAAYRFKRRDPYALILPFTNLPGFGSSRRDLGQSARVTWVRALTPRWLNELRLGFNRKASDILQESSGHDRSQPLGFPKIAERPVDYGYPNVTLGELDGIGESIVLPQQSITNTYHLINNVAWNPAEGRHLTKFGVEVRQTQPNIFLDLFSRGNWTFLGITGSPLQDLVLGVPIFVLAGKGDTIMNLRSTAWNQYFQDDFLVRPNLTLNLGLRYEYNSPPADRWDRLSVPDFSNRSLTCSPAPDCQFIQAGKQGVPRATYRGDKNNFAPRVGFAWRPFTSKPFVIRSGYGVFYDATILNRNVFSRLNPPFFNINVYANNGENNIQDIVSGAGLPVPPQVGLVDPNYRDGYVQQWNLDLQYQILGRVILDAAYVGSKGTALARQIDFNQARPGGTPPFPQFGPTRFITSDASSTYHSLQLRTEKRFLSGLTFLGAYTWSRSIDNSSAMFGTAAEPDVPQNSFDSRSERGLSNFHTKHRFVLSYVQDLPFGTRRAHPNNVGALSYILGGWQVAAILTVQSGRPFTVNRAIDQSQTGKDLGFSDRPDQIADPLKAGPVLQHPNAACHSTLSQGGRAADVVKSPDSWFNTCAFTDPGEVRFGTAGRNTVIGPGLAALDFSLLKNISTLGERHRLQLKFEFFNLTNHPNFDLPNRIFDAPTFSAIQAANAYGNKPPRQIQIGLRYAF